MRTAGYAVFFTHSCRRIFLRVPLSSPTKAQTPSTYFCARVQIHALMDSSIPFSPRRRSHLLIYTQIERQRKRDGEEDAHSRSLAGR